MTATVQDLITVLEMFLPGELPLNRAMYILLTLAALYPILRLHNNQALQPQQPRRTAWLKSIGALLVRAFHPEELDPYTWTNKEPGRQYADDMYHDISMLSEFLGLDNENNTPAPFALKSRLLICTSRLNCIICPQGENLHTLRQRAKMQSVRVLDTNLTWVSADLFIAHCPACRSDYYPDCITYRGVENERLQKLECDATYICISKHGVWVHRRIALSQEKALLRFHSGWSNFADWVNEMTEGDTKMTYRQSQRLFVEHFSRCLLIAHRKHTTFTCRAQPSTSLLAGQVREALGHDGGSIANAMKHGCMDCTHHKRYWADLIDEGAVLENEADRVVIDGMDDEAEVKWWLS